MSSKVRKSYNYSHDFLIRGGYIGCILSKFNLMVENSVGCFYFFSSEICNVFSNLLERQLTA